jgi:hypothetical protein
MDSGGAFHPVCARITFRRGYKLAHAIQRVVDLLDFGLQVQIQWNPRASACSKIFL